MNNTEEVHNLTEIIYKNLATRFTPQAKLILANGKAFHKSLLGHVIFRIAEVYKEIQMKFEDCTKALFAEIILPLEQKLDNEFKNATSEHRKYHQGHKEFLAPYVKAVNCLEKFNKKNQSKGVYDEEKEAPYSRAVFKYQEKLDEFRLQGLKLALLEERKCYCFILSHLVSVATVQLKYHDRGVECLTEDLATWRQMASQSHILPRSADTFLRVMDSRSGHSNGGLTLGYGYSGSLTGTYNQTGSQGDYMTGRPPSEYSLPSQPSPPQILHSSRVMMPPTPPQGLQVKALFAHVGNQDNQLKFTPGDILTLIGDPCDGWNYAYNPVTGGYGWLPLAFVEPFTRITHYNGPPPRAKSISDLKEHSLTGLSSNFSMDTMNRQSSVHERARTPSLHEPAMLKMMADAFQTPSSETGSLNSSTSINSQAPYTTNTRSGLDLYQSLPGEASEMHAVGNTMSSGGILFSAEGQNFHTMGHTYRSSSPPLPPPPMTTNYPRFPPHTGGSATVPNTPLTSSRPRSNSIGTYLPPAPQATNFNIPPPPTFDPPLPPPSFDQPLPSPAAPPSPQTPGRTRPPVSQKTTSLASMTSHSNVPPPVTPKLSGHSQAPANPPPPAPPLPKNPFSGVSLKKTKTDDRSAPRIK